MLDSALSYAKENEDKALEELFEFLKISSISAKPEHASDCRQAGEWVAEKLKTIGVENVELVEVETGGPPLVLGDWLHAGDAPTVLIYGHYDVQPVEPLELWETPPFEPNVRDGKVYARGTADDKGQLFLIIRAVESWLKSGKPPVNIRFLIEGEEESGGKGIHAFLKDPANHPRCKADFALIADSSFVSEGKPTITTALRGILYTELRVTGPGHDLHSGVAGGAVMNPLNALSWILAKLVDEKTGKVLIPGFYDGIQFTEQDRKEISELGLDEKSWLKSMGTKKDWGEEGFSIAERTGARPTLDINGIWGGFQGKGAKTVIASTAGAKVSMRLVPGQEPGDVFQKLEAYLKEITPEQITLEVRRLAGSKAIQIPSDLSEIKTASAVLEEVFGKKAVFERCGGSVPVGGDFKEYLGINTVYMGFGLPDDRVHSPNESFSLSQFHKGCQCVIRYLDALSSA